MRTRVKVCGITRVEDAERALALGADALGVIVYERSPRAVGEAELGDLLAAIPREKRVLVDVSTPTNELEKWLRFEPAAVQIHFDLEISMATLAGWSGLVGAESLWLAPRVDPQEGSFPQIIMEFAETLLVDAYDKQAYGGTGKAGGNWQCFEDWSLLYQHKRWILAGGLGPENVRRALAATKAQMIDVNSGVEKEPGIKDWDKLERLFAEVRAWDAERGEAGETGDKEG